MEAKHQTYGQPQMEQKKSPNVLYCSVQTIPEAATNINFPVMENKNTLKPIQQSDWNAQSIRQFVGDKLKTCSAYKKTKTSSFTKKLTKNVDPYQK